MAPFVAQYLYVAYGSGDDCRWIVHFIDADRSDRSPRAMLWTIWFP